jgi:hypothetical protein
LVWIKGRDLTYNNCLADTALGTSKVLFSNTTSGTTNTTGDVTAFNITGFTVGTNGRVNQDISLGSGTYVSWTFRKQPKFFDIVTYTGTGANRTIAHSLGSTPGMIIVKRTDTTGNWQVYHRSLTSAANSIQLNLDAAQASAATVWNSTAPTSSVFSVGTDATVNASGGTYVAYIYAHDAGGFGAAGTDSVVACGSYAGTSASGNNVTLGWEPQFILVKNISIGGTSTGRWHLFDTMRGWAHSDDNVLAPNTTGSEVEYTSGYIGDDFGNPTATGFVLNTTFSGINASGYTYIYLAIRRGPMKTPTDATKVYKPVTITGTATTLQNYSDIGFAADAILRFNRGSGDSGNYKNQVFDRLRGWFGPVIPSAAAMIQTVYTNAETTSSSYLAQKNDMGFNFGSWTGYNLEHHYFKRAPGFFDVVCYRGTGSTNNVVPHNLGVSPELVILKSRSLAYFWMIYHKVLGNTTNLYNFVNTAVGNYYAFSSSPTSTTITLDSQGDINTNNSTNVAYLFASCPGVSKVDSYTGNGSSQTIDCGFAAGARFVLIKRTDSTGDWYVWDTARGIVSGNDPRLSLNTTAAEVTTDDTIDPASSGFIVNQVAATNVNVSSASYIYLAIA